MGYSGEYDPRGVFWTSEDDGDDGDIGGWGLWELDLADTAGAKGDRAEAKRLVEGRILRLARDVYIRYDLSPSALEMRKLIRKDI